MNTERTSGTNDLVLLNVSKVINLVNNGVYDGPYINNIVIRNIL